MSVSYSGLGTTMNITASGTSTTVGFTTDVSLVAPISTDGDATEGEMYLPASFNDAQNAFGEDSAMFQQYRLAKANGADDVYCWPVVVQNSTESFDTATEGQLTETPLDPEVTSYTIDVTDTSDDSSLDVSTNYVDDESPSEGEAYVTPADNTIEFGAEGTYDVDYSYADYSIAEDAASLDVRAVGVVAEASTVGTELLSYIQAEATDFDFKRGVVGARPSIDVTDIADYSTSTTHQRIVESAPNRGYVDANNQQRSVGVILGKMASKPLGASMTYDSVNGFEEFDYGWKPSQASNFENVTAIADTMEIVEGVTTATEDAFSDIYKVEIIDAVAEGIQIIAKNFAGSPNVGTDREDFESDVRQVLNGYTRRTPPLLHSTTGDGEPYNVEANVGSTDTEVLLSVAIDPLDIVKEVIIDIAVGEVVTYEGVSAEETF